MRFIHFLTVLLLVASSCSTESPTAISYEKNGPLKHVVLLDLKDGCSEGDVDRVVKALYSLQEIEGVISLEVSARFETNDSRAKEDYDLMLYMEFASEETLYAYATDESHLAVREAIKPYMASAPEVLDTTEK